MQSGNVSSSKSRKNLLIFYFLVSFAILGCAFGIFCYLYSENRICDKILFFHHEMFGISYSEKVSAVLFDSLKSNVVFLITAFILGFGALSQPVQALLIFIKGFSCGTVLISIYGNGLSGSDLPCIAAVFPGMFISLIVIIIAARESFFLSERLFRLCFTDRLADGLFFRVRTYAVRFSVYAAMLSVCSLIDCGLSIILSV